jgi:hypothetical protein
MAGDLQVSPAFGSTFGISLTGSGVMTVNLFRSPGGAFNPELDGWLVSSIEYDFVEPTLEPTTLVLSGTAAAGFGIVRWSRWRASRNRHAA